MSATPDGRPNIVWINVEDTSPRRLGCYGDDLACTPNIDERIAGRGRTYHNAFCASPVCAPSRTAAITGMYATAIGCHQMRTSSSGEFMPGVPTPYEAVPPHYVKAFTEYLRRAGYYCTKTGKNDFQFGDPFTVWHEYADSGDPAAANWRDRPDGSRPFFASFQNAVTHESGMWEPGGAADLGTDPDAVAVPPYLRDSDRTRRAIARHYDNIRRADAWVGEILDMLESDGLAGETLVVLWSDHGEGLPRCKWWLYDGGIRVPLLVRWPGRIDPGTTAQEPVSTVDLAPTMLDVAGAQLPRHLHGRRFLGPDRDEQRRYVFATQDRMGNGYMMRRAVRDRRFKYIRNYFAGEPDPWIWYRHEHPAMKDITDAAPGELTGPQEWFVSERPAEEFYDLESDPHELHNLVDDPGYEKQLTRFREAYEEWADSTVDLGHLPEDQMVDAMWPEGTQPTTATPTLIANAADTVPQEPTPDGGTFEAPATVRLYCSTQGASVAYKLDDCSDWTLYSRPIRLPRGETVVRTKAVRYGYEESDERTAAFEIR